MIAQITFLLIIIVITFQVTKRYVFNQIKAKYFIPDKSNRKTLQLRQIQTQLFLAKLLIGYLALCIVLLYVRFI